MKTHTNCHNCNSLLTYKSKFNNRIDLRRRVGKTVVLDCENCKLSKEYSIKELYAIERKYVKLFGLLFWLIGTVLAFTIVFDFIFEVTWSYAMVVLLAPVSIPTGIYIWINKYERERARTFNNT